MATVGTRVPECPVTLFGAAVSAKTSSKQGSSRAPECGRIGASPVIREMAIRSVATPALLGPALGDFEQSRGDVPPAPLCVMRTLTWQPHGGRQTARLRRCAGWRAPLCDRPWAGCPSRSHVRRHCSLVPKRMMPADLSKPHPLPVAHMLGQLGSKRPKIGHAVSIKTD
jgi:hypothetical protein